MQPALFEHSIDHSRPHALMTVTTKHAGSLEYRYGDTGQVVSVLNIWYNQTCQVRAAALRWEASRLCADTAAYQRNPPFVEYEAALENVVTRMLLSATRLNAEADGLEQAGRAAFPVAATNGA